MHLLRFNFKLSFWRLPNTFLNHSNSPLSLLPWIITPSKKSLNSFKTLQNTYALLYCYILQATLANNVSLLTIYCILGVLNVWNWELSESNVECRDALLKWSVLNNRLPFIRGNVSNTRDKFSFLFELHIYCSYGVGTYSDLALP